MRQPKSQAPSIDIDNLKGLSIEALRVAWRTHLDAPLPLLRAPELLRRELADRLQARTDGGLDAALKRRLDVLARQTQRSDKSMTVSARPKTGSVITREWDGVAHSVVVLEDGFLFEGQTYGSLSQIAQRITGVKWSGPRFFGLVAQRGA